jgi:dethiobiotin synthetase
VDVLVITGTGTGVGKTVVTAAVAALATSQGRRVAVVKAAQTGVADGEPGDVDLVRELAPRVTTWELARYPDPLAPATAARRAGAAPVTPADIAGAVSRLGADHDLVLLEGAGGLLVRFDDTGTLADVAWALHAPVLVVTAAGLGTLNDTALTTEVLRARGLRGAGLVIGSWPAEPDLASRCNLVDLPVVSGQPLVGAIPAGAAALEPREFAVVAARSLAPVLGGEFDAEVFGKTHAA